MFLPNTQAREAKRKALIQAVKQELPNLERVIGWGEGFSPIHARPLVVKTEADAEGLIWGGRCVHNLVTYLTGYPDRHVGVVVKGCDSRTLVQLMQEGLVDREKVTVFGMPCDGVVDLAKIKRRVDLDRIEAVEFSEDQVQLIHDGGRETVLGYEEAAARKCLSCQYPNPLEFDHLIGKPKEPFGDPARLYERVEAFEKMSLAERFAFWQAEMRRCIRCYACRNACPLCVCRDQCVAESREPHWLTQETGVEQKWMFQMIHAMHLAGRCTECGECERACPMDIPVQLLKQKIAQDIKELFDYESGVDPAAVPPLSTFQVDEDNIEEREW